MLLPAVAPICALLCLLPQWSVPLLAKEPVTAPHGMVVAQEPLAADVGRRVLENGGNAVDAAVAVGFALAVTFPFAGNIGGGGFMLVRLANGKSYFLDFREAAPLGASRNMYIGADGNPTRDSLVGWRASGVPGSVKGFELAHNRWGSKDWKQLLQPSIDLAKKGFTVDRTLAASLSDSATELGRDPESRRIFLRNGDLYKYGETFRQPELAATLQRIAVNGAGGFYYGETAQKFAAAMKTHDGLITVDDLKSYRAIERTPLEGSYHGFDIITSPPPSAGGLGILQMLGILSGTKYASNGPDSAKAVHYMAETMKRFYADRSEYLGDPAFFHVPVAPLLDPGYLAVRRRSIAPDTATPVSDVKPGLNSKAASVLQSESNETTHFNVVDSYGNAVAVTYTLNGGYGSGVTVPGLGFLLNNEMDDFVAKPGTPNMFGLVGGDANAIEPGKRPLSSMDPTIVTRDGKLFLVVGAPGGSRITTGVMQVILDVLDFHMNPQDAVDLPRFHEQWKPDVLYMQKGFSDSTLAALKNMGYHIEPTGGVARVEAIVKEGGILQGGTESGQNGKVAGY